MLFHEYLEKQESSKIEITLKNGDTIAGTLAGSDSFLNLFLSGAEQCATNSNQSRDRDRVDDDMRYGKESSDMANYKAVQAKEEAGEGRILPKLERCFIRGSAIKMIKLPRNELLERRMEDATRIKFCLERFSE